MKQSDTPRTDAAEQFMPYFGWQVHADFARNLERELVAATRERDEALADLETERMRLAACDVVAMANTPESAARVRDILPKYFSASLHSVMGAVDREMELRAEVERLRSAFAHCHVRGPFGDLCAVCGLDLRDKVHTAITDGEAMSIDELVADVLTNYAVAWQSSDGAKCFGTAMELFNLIEQHVAEAVAREREECARACEDVEAPQWDEYVASYNGAVVDCVAAIRDRAEKETK